MTNIFLFTSIWIHVLSAIIWFGSVLAMEFLVIPSFSNNSGQPIGKVLSNMSKKYARLSEVASGLIFITGIYQTYANGYLDVSKLLTTFYGNLILAKILLFVIFAGLGVMAGLKVAKLDAEITSEKLEPILKKARNLFYIDIFVGLLIILIAIALRFDGNITL